MRKIRSTWTPEQQLHASWAACMNIAQDHARFIGTLLVSRASLRATLGAKVPINAELGHEDLRGDVAHPGHRHEAGNPGTKGLEDGAHFLDRRQPHEARADAQELNRRGDLSFDEIETLRRTTHRRFVRRSSSLGEHPDRRRSHIINAPAQRRRLAARRSQAPGTRQTTGSGVSIAYHLVTQMHCAGPDSRLCHSQVPIEAVALRSPIGNMVLVCGSTPMLRARCPPVPLTHRSQTCAALPPADSSA